MQRDDRLKHQVHDRRRQSHRRFVEHQHAGLGHEGAADGEHLLLAAAHQARDLAAPFLEPGKKVVDTRHQVVGVAAPGVAAQLQVLFDRERRDDHAPFGHQREPTPHDTVHRHRRDLFAVEFDRAFDRPMQAGDAAQRGGFARAVGTEDGDHAARLDLETEVGDGADGAVASAERGYGQHRQSFQNRQPAHRDAPCSLRGFHGPAVGRNSSP